MSNRLYALPAIPSFVAMLWVVFACGAHAQLIAPTFAQTGSATLVPRPAFNTSLFQTQIHVIPRVAPAGTKRWVVVRNLPTTQCNQSYGQRLEGIPVDALASALIPIYSTHNPAQVFALCPGAPPIADTALFAIAVAAPGTAAVQWAYNRQSNLVFEGSLETTPAESDTTTRDVNGMWFDPATNGSGISLHQSTVTGAVFGTWFMYDKLGDSRWYALQETRWSSSGKVLSGIFVETTGQDCAPLNACPTRATDWLPTYSFRMAFSDTGQARAEVLGYADEILFSSNMTRLVTSADATGGHSARNLDGMWFDPATNGSGISFHHDSATDVLFGTWFMYGTATGAPQRSRWYSLQGLRWNAGGLVAEGVLMEVSGRSTACAAANSCPRLADNVILRGRVRVSLNEDGTARVDATDNAGNLLFTSRVQRLQF